MWADDLVHQDTLRAETGLAAKAAAAAIGEYFAGVIAERRLHPTDDLISTLLATSVDGVSLPLEDLLGFAFLLDRRRHRDDDQPGGQRRGGP